MPSRPSTARKAPSSHGNRSPTASPSRRSCARRRSKSQRVSSGLSSRQDMATAQRAAVETMKLHARTNWVAGIALPANPLQAAKDYHDIARTEEAKLPALRAALNKMRSKNLERAGPSAFVEKMLASNGERAPWTLGRPSSKKQDPLPDRPAGNSGSQKRQAIRSTNGRSVRPTRPKT